MRILILGAGGIGGYFGARLQEAGGDVSFLVRPARAEALRRDGLRLKSPLGDATLQPKVLTGDQIKDAFDLVILSCKAYDLDSAIDAIAPAVGRDSFVLPLLNGLAHLDRLDARLGAGGVLGGVAQISVTLAPSGEIVHLQPMARLVAGVRNGGKPADAVLEPLGALFARAKVDYDASKRIMQDMWDKLMFLATLAAATCTMRAPLGVILDTVAGERFITGLLDEAERVAGGNGFPPVAQRVAAYRELLTQRGSKIAASMLRDIERGGPTEADHIVGDLIARGRRPDVAMPLLEIAYSHLQAYELQRAQRK
jgi:2-dehydropantoate 2-reductase